MNYRQSAQTASFSAFASLLKASLLIATLVALTASSGCRSGSPVGYNGYQGYNPAGYNQGGSASRTNPGAYNQGGYNPAGYNYGGSASRANPAGYNYGGSASRTNAVGAPSLARNSATIAPPATYSLNIPGGGVNPYAQGTRVGQLPSGLINTRQAAPTPVSGSAGGANSPANFNQQQGWRQINGGSLNTQSNTANPAAATDVARSVLNNSGSSTRAPLPQQNSAVQPNPFQQASASNAPAPVNRPQFNNVATTRSTDYQTTSVDERQDPTRLPVTDASGINTSVAQGYIPPATQPYYNRQQGDQRFQQPQLAANPSQPTPSFQGQFVQPVNSAYQGQFSNPVGSVGGQFAPPLSQPQLVQSESTAFYDPFTATASDTQYSGSDSRSY